MTLALGLQIVSLAILATTVVAQVPNCARNYTIRVGDVCDSISAAQNVSTFQLAQVNAGIINPLCDNLVSGETICLGIKGQDCNITTVVKSGVSCATIASRANITTALLLQNNLNVNPICTNIYPGEVLCTAKTAFVK